MSHFTVTVRLTAERLGRHSGDHTSALHEILAPYQENNMGDCPTSFLAFVDADEPELEPGQTRAAAMEANGYKQHPEDPNRYGYWENPNAKWDWWTIGGRWRGFYLVKQGVDRVIGRPGAFGNEDDGGSDVVRIHDIDSDLVATRERERFDAFKAERVRLLAGERFPIFEGPRDSMLNMGLLRVEHDPAASLAPGEIQVGAPWGEWREAALDLTAEQLERYRSVFNPLRTYAALDDAGWHEPGKMGWFGYASHTPDAYLAYADAFQAQFIKTAGPDDLLVVVDCHI